MASQFIRLAGLSTSVPDSKREYLSNRSKAAGIDAKLDLLDGFLWQETPGLQRQAVALVDQAIGIYNGNESRAWSNTRNPFFWITRFNRVDRGASRSHLQLDFWYRSRESR